MKLIIAQKRTISIPFALTPVVVVNQCTIINVQVSLGELKLFCTARFMRCVKGSVSTVHEYRRGLNAQFLDE